MSESDRTKWDEIYRKTGTGSALPTPLLVRVAEDLPRQGKALDLAGGTGRNALWLARRGLDVTLADISAIGLERAAQAAAEAGLPLQILDLDLEQQPLPAGPWDLIVVNRYLQRSLFPAFPSVLAPSGLLFFAQPTRKNLERHPKPSAAFLLEEGELPGLLQGLEILKTEEGWMEDGFHEAFVLARKRP